MMGSNQFLWAAVICLGVAVMLLGCSPELPANTPVPATDSPEPATATPAMPADSPLPTPARDTRLTPVATGLPEIIPGLTVEVKPLPEIVPAVTPWPPVTGEVPAALLDQIIADLAGRLGVPVGEIEVVRGEAVVWNDGSLGCAEPGMMYTQALVDGYWVVLEYEGQLYDYRATEGGHFRLCEVPGVGLPGMPRGGETE
jgi:hypothetical protein